MSGEEIEDIVEDEEKAEQLEELIEKKVKEQVERAVGTDQDNAKTEEEERNKVSRRDFLKKLGAGAAGIGALSLIPSASAFDIRSSDALEVFETGTKYFDVNPGGPVEVLNTSLDIQNDLKTTGGTVIWDSSNSYIPESRVQQGSGSGLNADTVDGSHASDLSGGDISGSSGIHFWYNFYSTYTSGSVSTQLSVNASGTAVFRAVNEGSGSAKLKKNGATFASANGGPGFNTTSNTNYSAGDTITVSGYLSNADTFRGSKAL